MVALNCSARRTFVTDARAALLEKSHSRCTLDTLRSELSFGPFNNESDDLVMQGVYLFLFQCPV